MGFSTPCYLFEVACLLPDFNEVAKWCCLQKYARRVQMKSRILAKVCRRELSCQQTCFRFDCNKDDS